MTPATTHTLPIISGKSSWNFWHLACAFLIGFLLQNLFLPCLCDIGTAKITLALVFDGLVAVRIFIAYLSREQGRGWIFYAATLYTSAGWITLLARLILGPDAW
jgi:hypothetical protein